MGSDDSERDDVPRDDVPLTPQRPEEQDAVPTITGLFDAPDVEERSEPAPVFTDPPQPDTDSVRILAEMFQGFRRKSSNSQQDLQQLLGTATQSIATIDAPKGSEPPATAGEIPIIAVDDGTDDEVDAEDVDDASNDEALAWLPTPKTTAEEIPVAPEDAPQTVKTAYVPRDGGNQTEQALAWLTAENVPTGQTPTIASAPALVPRRRHRWVAAVVAPILTAIALAVVYVVAFAVWPLSNVAATVAEADYSTPVAPAADLPWPETGQGAVIVEGAGDVVTSATDETPTARGPMASLTKVITVLVLLDRQPLEPGDDGPSYDFGYLDQQQAQTLRWLNNESALDVPIGGTLTYRQLLEGILMGSAGNFANKLVDELWEGDRDAYVGDALAWLQENGFFDTLVVDATGISPDNQSTPEDLVKIAELAMQNPTVAEIVAQEEIDLPGAGEVENSNPLLGEDGIAGIKTGHLDEWDVVSYNLMTAKDVTVGDDTDPIRVYSVVMGQPAPTEERPFGIESREVLDAVTERLQPVDAMAEQTILGTVTTPWGGRADVVADDTASLILWNGEEADVDVDLDVETGDTEGKTVGSVTIAGALDSTEIELVLADDLPRPSIGWRLTHPLELLGFGA